jgi:hypothetical protein
VARNQKISYPLLVRVRSLYLKSSLPAKFVSSFRGVMSPKRVKELARRVHLNVGAFELRGNQSLLSFEGSGF